jgi:hypothetical protein
VRNALYDWARTGVQLAVLAICPPSRSRPQSRVVHFEESPTGLQIPLEIGVFPQTPGGFALLDQSAAELGAGAPGRFYPCCRPCRSCAIRPPTPTGMWLTVPCESAILMKKNHNLPARISNIGCGFGFNFGNCIQERLKNDYERVSGGLLCCGF